MRVLVALVLLSRLALAAPSATTLFHEGVDALRDAQYETAADRFSRSAAIDPLAATYCNLALTYDRWQHHEAEAAAAYRACAEHDTTKRFREHASERARTLERELMERPPAPVVQPAPVVTPAPAPAPVLPAPVVTTQVTEPPRVRVHHHTLAIGAGVTGGLALGCLGGAIGLELTARSELRDDYTGNYDHAHALARAGIGLYVAGGALGVTSIALGIADAVRARR